MENTARLLNIQKVGFFPWSAKSASELTCTKPSLGLDFLSLLNSDQIKSILLSHFRIRNFSQFNYRQGKMFPEQA